MGKRKAKETGDNAGSGASDGNAEKTKTSGAHEQAQGAYRYCREQIKAFIQKLKADCEYIRETVEESLYNDGAGLLDDENLRKRLGTVAYIDSFFRHFGACLDFTDIYTFTSDMLPDRLHTAHGITDMKELERLPQRDDKLLNDIMNAGDDETWARNITAYIFALWVNYHVAPVVSAFNRWLEITGANAPAILRDYNALARCVCVFTLTEDNRTGGFFYDGKWFETFAICGMNRIGKAGDRSAEENKPRLNAHAAKIISEYRPRESLTIRTESGIKRIADFSPKQWDGIILLLEGEADGCGWVKMPDGWEKPKPNTDTQCVFWRRVHSKAQDYGDGAGYFRIERTPADNGKGGKRAGAGRKPRKA